ncbi:MAG: mismatch repair protein MutL [Myxococcales bacterium]|nr:mismatch repair protein MutL [Myxococcales bacterium]
MLPSELADQIAAGEVVERPASVVKELVENAIDAGARRIEIDVERGGLGRICISDDGSGMTPEEAHLALKRHATSKLSAIDDLFTLSSMGFRGEALPSIAAVSKLTLTTRAADAPDGDGAYELTVEGGLAGDGRRVGGPVGTRIEVRDLLMNVPARLKFLRGEATESAHVAEAVLRLALAFPSVHFRLRSDGRANHDLPSHPNGFERARVALGRGKTPAKLHRADGEEGGMRVEAYLGSPADSANTSRGSYLYVNRRFVRDRSLLHSLVMGYGETLDRGRYPLAVVHVTVPGAAVDVNVHPQKLEVRFARAQEVYSAVRHIVARAVAEAPWLADGPGSAVAGRASLEVSMLPPESRLFAREPQVGYAERRRRAEEAMRMFAPPMEPLFRGMAPMLGGLGGAAAGAGAMGGDGATGEAGVTGGLGVTGGAAVSEGEPGFFSSLTYLGQLHRTYLVCQAPGELVLIDQHAAHERVAFQRLRDAHGEQAVRSQRLLLPTTVELDAQLAAAAGEHAQLLGALGFELERFGEATVAVRAMPDVLAQSDPAEVLTEVLGELVARDATELVAEKLDHVLATMACHSVVRAGDVLGVAEVRALLESMDGIDYRAHCPHGRPVLLRMSVGEIERRFGRT